jgi:hypothetical protein
VAVLHAALAAAYARTDYEAAGAVARIGRRSAAVDALLRRLGVRQGGFVTAWNPYSRRRPGGWNARMQAALRRATRRLPGADGHGRGRGWAEAHRLVGADPRRLAVIARRFRQAGIVVVRQGAPARLVLLPPPLRRP